MNDEPKLPVLHSGGAIRPIIPQSLDEAWRLGNAVCVSGVAPKGLDTAEKAMIAIMHGLEVGLPPMAALQSIAVINGRPTLWGDGALGLVQGSGRLVSIKEWQEGEGDNRVAFCKVVRKGDPEPKIGKFSVADAKKAGLWTKSNSPWITYPERMLKMRARAWALRDGFADVLKGLGIAEEVRDAPTDTPAPVPPKPPAKSLSQPIEASPMPPVTPKTPPKPPKPKPVEEPVEEVIEDEVVEPSLSPGEMLSLLDEALENAQDADDIEQIWEEQDIEAKLQGTVGGAEMISFATGMKRKHMRRVS